MVQATVAYSGATDTTVFSGEKCNSENTSFTFSTFEREEGAATLAPWGGGQREDSLCLKGTKNAVIWNHFGFEQPGGQNKICCKVCNALAETSCCRASALCCRAWRVVLPQEHAAQGRPYGSSGATTPTRRVRRHSPCRLSSKAWGKSTEVSAPLRPPKKQLCCSLCCRQPPLEEKACLHLPESIVPP